MTTQNRTINRRAHLLGLFAAAALTACGGGGGSSPPPPPPPPAGVTISGKAVDGALQGATACYDLNDNGACDGGEPTSTTAASGAFQFDVTAAAAGHHRVVIEVPASAIDAPTGAAVGTAFTMQSPATGTTGAQNVFASPLTTLVQARMDASGATLAAATDHIKAQAGIAISPLADFTGAANADNTQAAMVARLAQLTLLKQAADLATIVGQVDTVSGATIGAADVAKLVAKTVTEALPVVSAALADPAIAGASGPALQTALVNAAQAVVAQAGVTPDEAKSQIGVDKLPTDATADTPVAGATLTAVRYTNPNVWYYRTLEASAADNTPDANNRVRYYEAHKSSEDSGYSANGVAYGWAYNNTRARTGDLHWDGSAWVSCALGDRYSSTKRDAEGRSSYEYCKNGELGNSTRSLLDLGGQSIATVFAEKIRVFPGGASGVAYSNWGPANLATFGAATFPAGSKLIYQSNEITATAPFYDPVPASGAVNAFSVAVAAGGDARTGDPACKQVTSANSPSFQSAVTTLEALVARNPGQPCVFAQGTNADGTSLSPSEWWSNSTVSLGTIAGAVTLPDGTGNYYSTTALLRVAFAATGNATTFYRCLQRRVDGSTRNCTPIGTGTYAIQTLGDARVMSFTNLPSTTSLGFSRVFVERGGQVWFGYKNLTGVTNKSVRLNLDATNAVFKALPGMPPVRPVTRYDDMSTASKAALTTMKGVWGEASDTDAVIFRFGDAGRFMMGEGGAENLQTREQTGGELGWFDYDAASQKFRTLLEVDGNMTAGTSHPGQDEENATLTVTATQLSVSGGITFSRLAGGTTGIVGLWALNSATDLKTQHFAFFPNGKVLMVDPLGDTQAGACTIARQGPPGGEFASYEFNASSGALRVFGKIYDTNGCAGFFDSSQGAVQAGTANTEANFTVQFSGDGKSATVTEGAESFTLYRIAIQ